MYGTGVAWSGAQTEVVALAEKLSIPVATSLNAKGTILNTHPLSVGVAGTYSRTYANRAVAEADLVFLIGSHTGSQVTAEWRGSVSVNVSSDAVPMRLERVCREIARALPEGGVLVCDTGHSSIWGGTLVDFTKPGQRLIRCAGSLGWGFPGALGVKCAPPDVPVVCLAGDGSLYYNLGELETAARYGINLIMIVNNNSSLKQEIPFFEQAYSGDPGERGRAMWTFRKVNFAKVAELMGCLGIRVGNPAQLSRALDQALAARQPVVIDAVTDYRAFPQRIWTGA